MNLYQLTLKRSLSLSLFLTLSSAQANSSEKGKAGLAKATGAHPGPALGEIPASRQREKFARSSRDLVAAQSGHRKIGLWPLYGIFL